MEDEFDIDVVHRLVDDAVGGRNHPPAPPAHLPSTRVPFGIYDTRLLERLSPLLVDKGMHQADIQMVFDDLRGSLLQDLDNRSLQDLHSFTLNCKRCPNLQNATLPIGNLASPDLVFVADYPQEEWPFEISDLLIAANIDINSVALTFTTRCSPQINRSATSEEINNCSSYLYSELQLLSPKLIVPLGNTAGLQFLNPLKLADDHGMIFYVGPWAIMPTYALGYLTRKESARQEITNDLHKARNFLYG